MDNINANCIPQGFEHKEILSGGENYRIERIISNCCPSPEGFFYDQEEDEWVMILEGEARLLINGKISSLKKGDSLLIKRHVRHRVESTSSDCRWLCVFMK